MVRPSPTLLLLLRSAVDDANSSSPSFAFPAARLASLQRPSSNRLLRRVAPTAFGARPSCPVVIAASAGDGTASTTTDESYASLTVPMLKDVLRERGLPVSGTKAVLLGRLRHDDAEQRAPISGGIVADGGDDSMPLVVGAEERDAAEVEGMEDYRRFTVVRLKEMCRERSLPVSGTKAVLVRRLVDNDGEATTVGSSDEQQVLDSGSDIVDDFVSDESFDDDAFDGNVVEMNDNNALVGDQAEQRSLDELPSIETLVETGDSDDDLEKNDDSNSDNGAFNDDASVEDPDAEDYLESLADSTSDDGPGAPWRSSRSPNDREESRKLWSMARGVEKLVKSNDPLAVPVAEELIRSMMARYKKTGNVRFRPTERSYTLLINAHAKSGLPEAARCAEEVLRKMQTDDDVPVRPNVYTYTAVIDAYARSPDPDAAERAEAILYEMMDRASWDPGAAPSYKTGDAVLNAWARRGTEDGAERAGQLLERIGNLEKQRGVAAAAGDDEGGMRLTTSSFATVITGWGRVRGRGAAEKAEELLNRLIVLWEETEDEERKNELRPNTVLFNAVIDAWGKSRDPQAGMKAEALLMRMQDMADENEELDIEPDEFSFNSCINSYAVSGHKNAARLAEGLLKKMQERGKVPPNTISYNSVLNAWSKSKVPGAAERAEQILLYMIDAYSSGNQHVKPSVFSFSGVLNARAKTREPGKARRAQAILHRLTEVYEKMAGMDEDLKPNTFCYNGVLNAAAFSVNFDEEERKDALQVAVETFSEMKKSGHCQPDSVSYGNMLKCFANLMPMGGNRNRMGAQMFESCCRDGQVGEMVLNEIQRVVPRKVFLSLVEGKARGGPKLSPRDLPRRWTCNVNERGTYVNKVKPTRKALKRRENFRKKKPRRPEPEEEPQPVYPVARNLVEGSWDSAHDV